MATVNWDKSTKKTLTIASSGTDSDTLDLASLGKTGKWTLTIATTDSAFTGTITIQTLHNITDSTYSTLQSGGSDVNINPQKSMVTDPINVAGFRIHSSAAEALERTFFITGTLEGN